MNKWLLQEIFDNWGAGCPPSPPMSDTEGETGCGFRYPVLEIFN